MRGIQASKRVLFVTFSTQRAAKLGSSALRPCKQQNIKYARGRRWIQVHDTLLMSVWGAVETRCVRQWTLLRTIKLVYLVHRQWAEWTHRRVRCSENPVSSYH